MLILGVVALLVIAGSTALAERRNVPAPLVLVVVGIAVSLVPAAPVIEPDPEWVLAGVLPPLLYSASVAMPTMNFRREFGAISGLSVLLVVVTAVVLGLVLSAVVPGLSLAWGIALGAVLSPTDAVATSIARRAGVSPRVRAMLEGESLLNDASALVLLRTAVVGAAATVQAGEVVGSFVLAVLPAVAVGYLVGRANLAVRARLEDPTVTTVLSFTVPFVAAVPVDLLGGSGLVAAVTAGIVTGIRAPRVLSPQQRLSDAQNWRTVELVLEGAVFLLLGLELTAVVADVRGTGAGPGGAVLLAALALLLVLAIRTVHVTLLLRTLARRAERHRRLAPHVRRLNDAVLDPEKVARIAERYPRLPRRGRGDLERVRARLRRTLADMDYFLAVPLGWRDGGVIVWAGMRGAITVAAAQTLPHDAPDRSLLVLVAYVVATGSLLLQGGTLAAVVRVLRPTRADPARRADERRRLDALLTAVEAPDAATPHEAAVLHVEARRAALLDARDDGAFDADLLTEALAALDAHQLSLEAARPRATP
nr:cation:proton antiporter [Cellulomonas sp. APG4]